MAAAVLAVTAVVALVWQRRIDVRMGAAPSPAWSRGRPSSDGRMADRFVRCTSHVCDRLPPTDSDDPSSAVVFSSVLHSDNSASFLQRSVAAFERVDEGGGGGGADELLVDSQSAQEGEHVLLGFGGAFTDAAADAFASVPAGLQAQILRQYFGPDGIGYRLGRVPIGGTDFSPRAYTYDDGAPGDLALRNFSLAADERHKLPLLHAALALSPELELIASPWSAPAFMKDSGSLVWGALLGEPGGPYYRAWAAYLCRFISEYAARGVHVRWLTVQNEPTFSLVTRFTVHSGTRCSRMRARHGTAPHRTHRMHRMHRMHPYAPYASHVRAGAVERSNTHTHTALYVPHHGRCDGTRWRSRPSGCATSSSLTSGPRSPPRTLASGCCCTTTSAPSW